MINSGTAQPVAARTGGGDKLPITSTLMGLGAYPASGDNWLGMLGMHGLYEANMAMHGCDLMINIGARFDDRITGVWTNSARTRKKRISTSTPSSINKVVHVDIPIVGDVAHVLEDLLQGLEIRGRKNQRRGPVQMVEPNQRLAQRRLPQVQAEGKIIKPQYALQRLEG